MLIVTAGVFTACSDDDDLPNGGKPTISYVRVTDPASADSLIEAAGQGSMIVIVGENLQGIRELWINDRQAQLIPTFISNTSVFTRVPSRIPAEITNKMKLMFANGDSLIHDFTVEISAPVIDRLVSEVVPIGQVAEIRGDYFYEPIVVTFSGGVVGEIVELEDDMIQVVVPEGAEPGPITVTTNFGEDESDFWFNDNRNVIADFEGNEADGDFEGWWHGKDFIVASDAEISPISGKFIRINRELAAWAWFEMWVGNGATIMNATSNIPADAFANAEEYSMKFEINTLAPLTGAEMRMYMGPDMQGERDENYYIWKPNVDTNGQWQTVSIPFDDLVAANPTLAYDPAGYQVSFHFNGPLAVHANFGLDNIRVVPN